jgi:molybdate transport system regulatory protein
MAADTQLKALLQLRGGSDARVGPERIRLLEAIARLGSISAAAKAAGLSYKGAWDAVQALNNLSGRPLVLAQPGGRSGGAAQVTAAGQALIAAFGRLERELAAVAERLGEGLAADGALEDVIWSLGMRTTARNALSGVVREVKEGAVNAEVVLEVSPAVRIVAIVTLESVRELGLEPGRRAAALIKSSFVVLAAGEAPIRTSARNSLKGVVVRHERGAVNDELTLQIDEGKTVTATVTRESAEALGLAVGSPAQALIKASHVILAVE